MDQIVVKGKTDPVRIFELIHPMVLNEQGLKDLLGEFQLFRTSYIAQDWPKVRAHLGACLRIRPGDGPSMTFLERLEERERLPKLENWDGVHIFTHK